MARSALILSSIRGKKTARGRGVGLVVAEACSAESKHSKRLLGSTAINLNELNAEET
jgi:hypothetical protein